MKKVLLILMFSAMFFTTGAFADFSPSVQKMLTDEGLPSAAEEAPAPVEEESKFPDFVCIDDVTYSILPENVQSSIVTDSEVYTFVTSANAENVDKKNKTVTIWLTVISKWKGRESRINDNGTAYEKYGYSKYLTVIDIKNKKYRYKSGVNYNCDGTIIEQFNNNVWDYVVPGSIMDDIKEKLKQKYKM